ncbi:MAG: four helix bundle protein [Candidatus Dojkabacteria bacterium]
MKKENIILDKSYSFSIQIVQLYKVLISNKEYVLSKQLLRCGTSVGANIYEAQGSISKKEFIVKMQISYKELIESGYWLNLLKDTDFITNDTFNRYIGLVEEIKRILVSIQKKMK